MYTRSITPAYFNPMIYEYLQLPGSSLDIYIYQLEVSVQTEIKNNPVVTIAIIKPQTLSLHEQKNKK